jgi:hypothetical protein
MGLKCKNTSLCGKQDILQWPKHCEPLLTFQITHGEPSGLQQMDATGNQNRKA